VGVIRSSFFLSAFVFFYQDPQAQTTRTPNCGRYLCALHIEEKSSIPVFTVITRAMWAVYLQAMVETEAVRLEVSHSNTLNLTW